MASDQCAAVRQSLSIDTHHTAPNAKPQRAYVQPTRYRWPDTRCIIRGWILGTLSGLAPVLLERNCSSGAT
jgi:hypothetical protein